MKQSVVEDCLYKNALLPAQTQFMVYDRSG